MIDRDDEFGMSPLRMGVDRNGLTPLSLSIVNATHKVPVHRKPGSVHWPLVISAMLALLLAMWWTGT